VILDGRRRAGGSSADFESLALRADLPVVGLVVTHDLLGLGFQVNLRPKRMAMLARWQVVTARWCVKTSETGSVRSLVQAMKLPMWVFDFLPLRSFRSTSSGIGSWSSCSTGFPLSGYG